LDEILECDIVGLSLYLITNIDLNVPFFFALVEGKIIDYSINKIWN
jgi:hypothetical protein